MEHQSILREQQYNTVAPILNGAGKFKRQNKTMVTAAPTENLYDSCQTTRASAEAKVSLDQAAVVVVESNEDEQPLFKRQSEQTKSQDQSLRRQLV